jgi:hypothetical protein
MRSAPGSVCRKKGNSVPEWPAALVSKGADPVFAEGEALSEAILVVGGVITVEVGCQRFEHALGQRWQVRRDLVVHPDATLLSANQADISKSAELSGDLILRYTQGVDQFTYACALGLKKQKSHDPQSLFVAEGLQ